MTQATPEQIAMARRKLAEKLEFAGLRATAASVLAGSDTCAIHVLPALMLIAELEAENERLSGTVARDALEKETGRADG